MEQHPVPQNIATFEFKLFGNLTVRQFVTLIIPMSLAAIIFFSNITPVFRLSASIILALFGLFIALVPMGGRPFDKWVVAFVKAVMAPTQRIWSKEKKLPEFLSVMVRPPKAEEKIPEEITAKGRERLSSYLRSLPKRDISALDEREQAAIEKLGLTEEREEEGKLPPAIVWADYHESLPQLEPRIMPSGTQREYGGMLSMVPSGSSDVPNLKYEAAPRIQLHAKPYSLAGLEGKLKKSDMEVRPVELIKTPPVARLASDINSTVDNVIPIQLSGSQVRLINGVGRTRVRKLHFSPPAGFDLSKLGIRGERRYEISEELKRRLNVQDLMEEQIKKDLAEEMSKSEVPQVAPEAVGVADLPNGSTAPQAVVNPKAAGSVAKPVIQPEAQKVSLKPQTNAPVDSKISIEGQRVPAMPATASRLAQIVPLTNRPNVISGLTIDAGEIPVSGAVIVVRDQNGMPVRAFKTNKLGQFLSATPLPNDTYTIEVESDLAQFRPLKINLVGNVMSPLEIKAEGGR